MNRTEILEKVYGPCEWSESARSSLMAVMDLTCENEREVVAKEVEEFANIIASYQPRWWDWKLRLIMKGHTAAYKLVASRIRQGVIND